MTICAILALTVKSSWSSVGHLIKVAAPVEVWDPTAGSYFYILSSHLYVPDSTCGINLLLYGINFKP